MKIRTCDITVKSLSVDGIFKGYASVFNTEDAHGDVVCAGAFLKTLVHWRQKGVWPKMLWQHNHDQVIGVWTNMLEDEKGLYVEGKLLLDVAKAREAYTLLKEKAVDHMSIGYVVKRSGHGQWRDRAVTFLREVDLLEVSLVTFPANDGARVLAVKSAADASEVSVLEDLRGCGSDADSVRAYETCLKSRTVNDDFLDQKMVHLSGVSNHAKALCDYLQHL
eukprot:gene20364-26430_t